MRLAIMSRGVHAPVGLAQRIGGTFRRIIDSLEGPRPVSALARHQLSAIRQRVDHLLRQLDDQEDAGEDATEIAGIAARTYRTMFQVRNNPTHQAARLAQGLSVATRLAVHGSAALPPEARTGEEDAFAAVVRAFGVGQAALAFFALEYPELAVKIDRASLDRLVLAWTSGIEGGKWPALTSVWKDRFKVSLAPVSIKNEMKNLR
jgi:hypothetical protein